MLVGGEKTVSSVTWKALPVVSLPAEYLACAAMKYKGSGLDKPFVDELGISILSSARKKFNDDVHTLLMFQNVIASSTGSQRFVFATTDDDITTPIPLQHYNRCFIMKDHTPEMENSNLAFADIPMPKMIQINKMLLSPADIANAEHVLCMNGIREIDAHNVLAKVMVALTGTNID